jgi:hypothetical protein
MHREVKIKGKQNFRRGVTSLVKYISLKISKEN